MTAFSTLNKLADFLWTHLGVWIMSNVGVQAFGHTIGIAVLVLQGLKTFRIEYKCGL